MKKFYSSIFIFIFILLFSEKASAVVFVSGTNGGALDGVYNSLTNPGGVFDVINSGGSQAGQTILCLIVNDLLAETGTFSLEDGDWAGLNIYPSGARIVSGTVNSAALIHLNGADNVNIDGLTFTQNSLQLINYSVSATPNTSTIRMDNGATNNYIAYCLIKGSSQNGLNVPGGTIYIGGDTLTPNGNDDNIIFHNGIGPANDTLPFKQVLSLGLVSTPAIRNSGNQLLENQIFDFFGDGTGNTSGVNIIEGNDTWFIQNNVIYQSNPRAFTAPDLRYSGITLNNPQSSFPGSHSVISNFIGFENSAQVGVTAISGLSNDIRGIDAPSVSTTAQTIIDFNTISGFTQTSSRSSTSNSLSAFIAVSMGPDGLFSAAYNNIGSQNGSSSIVLTLSSVTAGTAPAMGFYNFTASNTNISFNNIGSITINGSGTVTGFRGIYVNSAVNTNSNILENLISGIIDQQIGNYEMIGIKVLLTNANVVSNIIRNMAGNANGAVLVMSGIVADGSIGNNNVEKNRIYKLNNTVTGGAMGTLHGIDVTFPATFNEVKQNYVYALSVISVFTAYPITGINRRALGNANVYNNMISLGLNTDGSSVTTGYNITGIRDNASAGGNYNYYYNTVYIGGNVSGPTSNSYAFYSSVVSNTRIIKNNIFYNERSNTFPGGNMHFAARYSGTGINPTGLQSNFNNFYSSGIDGVLGEYNGLHLTILSWQTATGLDSNSVSVPVMFLDPPNGDLDLIGTSIGDENLKGMPIPGINTDIHKNIRDSLCPYMGAHEPPVVLPVELTSFSSFISHRDVTLNWTTASETNNSGFDIERSSVTGVWLKVGSVTGNGTTTFSSNYNFTDRNLISGNYSYRLKQIDFNGNFEYFNLSTEVNVGVPNKFHLSQNYPNPFNPATKINFDLPVDGNVSIKIFDISGKEVMTLVNEVKTAGYYSVNFNGANLSSGVYFYKLTAGNFSEVKKMSMIK